jgi:hypothetical protein
MKFLFLFLFFDICLCFNTFIDKNWLFYIKNINNGKRNYGLYSKYKIYNKSNIKLTEKIYTMRTNKLNENNTNYKELFYFRTNRNFNALKLNNINNFNIINNTLLGIIHPILDNTYILSKNKYIYIGTNNLNKNLYFNFILYHKYLNNININIKINYNNFKILKEIIINKEDIYNKSLYWNYNDNNIIKLNNIEFIKFFYKDIYYIKTEFINYPLDIEIYPFRNKCININNLYNNDYNYFKISNEIIVKLPYNINDYNLNISIFWKDRYSNLIILISANYINNILNKISYTILN